MFSFPRFCGNLKSVFGTNGASTEREGIVVVEVRLEISAMADFTQDSRSLVSGVECSPAPKSWRRRDTRL